MPALKWANGQRKWRSGFVLEDDGLSSGASQAALGVKNLPANAGDIGDMGSIPGSGRSPGGRYSNPIQ